MNFVTQRKYNSIIDLSDYKTMNTFPISRNMLMKTNIGIILNNAVFQR